VIYGDTQGTDAIWDSNVEAERPGDGIYVAVTGNTGAGKSTLIREAGKALEEEGYDSVVINERAIHHPLLKLMFAYPDTYAFGVQLNFMVQRYLALTRWLDLGKTVLIERSHLDDELFMRHHLDKGHITESEFKAYKSVFNAIKSRLPLPNLVVVLDVPPEVSINRITRAENRGERPKEFPSQNAKQDFVVSWHSKYKDHFVNIDNMYASIDDKRVIKDRSSKNLIKSITKLVQQA